jgi:hypothetical protein
MAAYDPSWSGTVTPLATEVSWEIPGVRGSWALSSYVGMIAREYFSGKRRDRDSPGPRAVLGATAGRIRAS